MPEALQRELFAELLGSTLEARAGAGDPAQLRIDDVVDLGAGDGTRFSVLLSGPGDRLLGQGIHQMRPPGGETFELFIVPVGHEQDRYLYEAAFNRDAGATP